MLKIDFKKVLLWTFLTFSFGLVFLSATGLWVWFSWPLFENYYGYHFFVICLFLLFQAFLDFRYTKYYEKFCCCLSLYLIVGNTIVFCNWLLSLIPSGPRDHFTGSCFPFVYYVSSLKSDCLYEAVNYFWFFTLGIPFFSFGLVSLGSSFFMGLL